MEGTELMGGLVEGTELMGGEVLVAAVEAQLTVEAVGEDSLAERGLLALILPRRGGMAEPLSTAEKIQILRAVFPRRMVL